MPKEPFNELERMECEIKMLRRICAYGRNCCQLAAVLTELASREIQAFGQKEPGMIQPTSPEGEEERGKGDNSSGFIPPPFAWN